MENLFTLPFILTALGMAGMLLPACLGSALGVSLAGNALIGGLKKNPDMFGSGMILCALPSTQGLYGFGAFFLFLLNVSDMEVITLLQASLTFVSGLTLGLVGYYSAKWQANLVSNGIVEISNGQDVFGKTMILAVYPELYAILAFAGAFLVWVFVL